MKGDLTMAQLSKALFSSTKEDWATPQDFFDKLNEEFHFDLDPCADAENAKCKEYFTKEENGLLKDCVASSAIHHTAEQQRANGSGSVTKKRRSPERLSLYLFRRELTQGFFTITYTTKRKFASLKASEIRRLQGRGAVPVYGGYFRKGKRA